MIYATSIAAFLAGIVSGAAILYYYVHEPFIEDYREMANRIYMMKKQGFVPQFEVDQPRENDPASEVREY